MIETFISASPKIHVESSNGKITFTSHWRPIRGLQSLNVVIWHCHLQMGRAPLLTILACMWPLGYKLDVLAKSSQEVSDGHFCPGSGISTCSLPRLLRDIPPFLTIYTETSHHWANHCGYKLCSLFHTMHFVFFIMEYLENTKPHRRKSNLAAVYDGSITGVYKSHP